jgi:hypothetical protein
MAALALHILEPYYEHAIQSISLPHYDNIQAEGIYQILENRATRFFA